MNADPITAIQILGFQLSGMENNLQITRIIFLMLSFPFKFFKILLVPKVFILWTILSRKPGFEPE